MNSSTILFGSGGFLMTRHKRIAYWTGFLISSIITILVGYTILDTIGFLK